MMLRPETVIMPNGASYMLHADRDRNSRFDGPTLGQKA